MSKGSVNLPCSPENVLFNNYPLCHVLFLLLHPTKFANSPVDPILITAVWVSFSSQEAALYFHGIPQQKHQSPFRKSLVTRKSLVMTGNLVTALEWIQVVQSPLRPVRGGNFFGGNWLRRMLRRLVWRSSHGNRAQTKLPEGLHGNTFIEKRNAGVCSFSSYGHMLCV